MGRGRAVALVLSAGDFPREALTEVIECAGCEAVWAGRGGDSPDGLRGAEPAVILADEDAPGLRAAVQTYRTAPIVLAVQTGRARPPIIEPVFRKVSKPVRYAEVVFSIERALLYRGVAVDCWEDESFQVTDLLGSGEAMRRVYGAVTEAGGSGEHVLICGERGVGKSVLARAVSRQTGCAHAHWVDARRLDDARFEAEVVAPLWALSPQPSMGIVGSLLVLGEVGTLSQSLQSTLLTALRERRVRFSAAAVDIAFDVRVIATSSDRLEKLAGDGRFRKELAELLGRREVHVLPLRERPDDVLHVARAVVRRLGGEAGFAAPRLPSETEAALVAYRWPGNVRELRTVVARAAVLADDVITPAELRLPDAGPEAMRQAVARILANRARARMLEEAVLPGKAGNATRGEAPSA